MNIVTRRMQFYQIGKINPCSLNNFKQAEIKKDFADLRELAEKKGFFKPSYTFFILQALQIIILHILGYYIILNFSDSNWGMFWSVVCLSISQVIFQMKI